MAFLRSQTSAPLLAIICSLFLTPAGAIIHHTVPHPANPYLDPKNDPYNPLRYITSNVLTAVAFSLVIIVAILQTVCVRKYGAKWMLSMVIGCYTFAFGLGTRFALHKFPESKGWYIVEYLFVVLSPCAFIAADYVLLGRIALHLDASHFLLVPARKITIAFISSDITTFLIQASGGALSVAANDVDKQKTGSHVRFTAKRMVRRHAPETWVRDQHGPWFKDWRTLAFVLLISCIGILIRSGYRVVELSQGFLGRLATSEGFFYGLDTLPLFLAISVYVPFWPGRFIENVSTKETPPPSPINGVEKGQVAS
ncbi:hypothetical protein H0H93_009514 [Arthromyces matolae]|nr:hypothetical protein H0H93_009514 [Arthromyces matolae]